jgi:aromatic ring hydroxylase
VLSSVIQNSTSSDIKISRIFFLFVLRLRTANDLRDQADLASARSVTIGSWFSDCIGASGSLIVVGREGLLPPNRNYLHSPKDRALQLYQVVSDFQVDR